MLESTSAGTGLKGLEELHIEMQQTAVDGFSLAGGTIRSKQGGVFCFQADIGVNPETTTQVIACQEFVRLPMSRKQRGMIVSSSEQSKRFDPSG